MGRHRDTTPRVLGPYYEPGRGRWRVLTVRADGARTAPRYFRTESEAKANASALARALGQRRVGPALDEWIEHRRTVGDGKPITLRNIAYRLGHLLEREHPLARVDQRYLEARALAVLVSGDQARETIGRALMDARTWLRWCADRAWIKMPELRPVRLPGRPRRGKRQLTQDEAKALLTVALADLSPLATAVIAILLLGLRAGEILDRVVRDLDADGTELRVLDRLKTDGSARILAVPAVLQPRLRALAAGKDPGARLIGTRHRATLSGALARLCKRAGVPRVCPHGLRGTWASLAWRRSSLPEEVARSLGHASPQMTRDHYLGAGVADETVTANVARVMGTAITETGTPAPN